MLRLLPTLLVALAACTQPDDGPRPAAPAAIADAVVAAADTLARASAAGLSPEQTATLHALGVPIAVPVLPDDWQLTSVTASRPGGTAFGWPDYALTYRRDNGACLTVLGSSEGLGDVMVDEPPARRDARAPDLATGGPVELGWAGPVAGTAEGWETPRLESEWFGLDAIAYRITSEATADCRRVRPEAAVAFVASLRYLDARDGGATGEWTYAEAGDAMTGASPEAAVRAAFAPEEPAEGRQSTSVQTLHARPAYATVMLTTTGLADDSVADERVRAAMVRQDDGVWALASAGRQVRCQRGRGHTGWSAEPCQ